MVKDPYQVLGISRDATEDEIKKAYRKKAKECHPDLHPDDPNAQQKMNEVNEAYDMLKNPEKYRSQQQSSYSSQGYSNYSGQSQQAYTNFYDFFYQQNTTQIPMPNIEPGDSDEIVYVINLIRSRDYRNAYSKLTNMTSSYRNARWYYLYALTCYGMGYRENAFEAIQRAVQMEPNHAEYRNVYNILRQAQSQNTTYGNPFVYRTVYRRGGHGLLWYIIMFQIIMWLISFLFGGFGYSRSSYDDYYYNNGYNQSSPSEQYERSNQNSGYFD